MQAHAQKIATEPKRSEFMLFVVRPENQARVRERLGDLIHVTFDFDTSGSKIVVFEPDGFANT